MCGHLDKLAKDKWLEMAGRGGRGTVVGMRGQKKLPLLRKSCGKLPLATYPMYKRHETIIASGNVELGHIQYTWMPKSIQVQNPAGVKNVQIRR